MREFQVGDRVFWIVAGHYGGVRHEGVVRAYIPANTNPGAVYPPLLEVPYSYIKLGNGKGRSKNARYLIEVPRFRKFSGETLPSHWYGPYISRLSLLEN